MEHPIDDEATEGSPPASEAHVGLFVFVRDLQTSLLLNSLSFVLASMWEACVLRFPIGAQVSQSKPFSVQDVLKDHQ